MRKFLTAAAATALLAACSNADSGTATADTATKTSNTVKEAASGSSKTYNKAAKFDGAKLFARRRLVHKNPCPLFGRRR